METIHKPFSYIVPINRFPFLSQIYDLNGKLVKTLHDNFLSNGSHSFTWNAQNFSSGIYIVNIGSDETYISSKISLLK